SDMDETAEQGIAREVKEETNLDVTDVQYLFSRPNIYPYSGFDVHTLDLFFLCRASNYQQVKACDDAESFRWIPLNEVNPACFGLTSIRQGVEQFLKLNARII
ncbi:MAG: NUDIX domain-containing protein, partial [Prevotellaceae bacterium]|nr:NUDIX domain-containing protein [Prevotellaceae bacterium]